MCLSRLRLDPPNSFIRDLLSLTPSDPTRSDPIRVRLESLTYLIFFPYLPAGGVR